MASGDQRLVFVHFLKCFVGLALRDFEAGELAAGRT